MAGLFASTWGNPNATKRILLVHGLMSSSTTWHQVAPEFASRGWFVIAPDLLGHGQARRGSDYTMPSLKNELLPYLTSAEGDDHPYDIVIGHSIGGLVVAALLPHLKSTRPVHVVLIDPPFEADPEFHAACTRQSEAYFENLKSPEQYQQENPSWPRRETIIKSANDHLCDVPAVVAIMGKNIPWSFSHLLSASPDNVKLTVLAADPSMDRLVTEEDMKQFSHVTTKIVWGASHNIQRDHPQAIVEAALEQSELKD